MPRVNFITEYSEIPTIHLSLERDDGQTYIVGEIMGGKRHYIASIHHDGTLQLFAGAADLLGLPPGQGGEIQVWRHDKVLNPEEH